MRDKSSLLVAETRPFRYKGITNGNARCTWTRPLTERELDLYHPVYANVGNLEIPREPFGIHIYYKHCFCVKMASKGQVATDTDNTFPPSPPRTVGNSHAGSDDEREEEQDEPPTPPLEILGQLPKPYALPPQNTPTQVLAEDLKTPDRLVNRDPRLIRLTGVHPFNVEPPLTDLYDEGFLTSENLHYVRNHGLVPHCPDDESLDWTFTVDGLVEKPFTITVRDLIETYDQFTYPVTLVCAGNRRKEQNVVRKSKGFSWGAAGLSTALWTGVPIGALLRMAKPSRAARYVCFEGADKLPNGYYGTSVKLNWCLDENRGIMVAHKMNGQPLHPDHGKPVRIIIPGQIGGRSVKWLKKITITSEPSDNWYHIYDNRVLPTTLSPDASANLPDVWKDERYAIYDLNVNSAICYPRHDERLLLATAPETYEVRGYAYGGGGKRITRVEVTLDKGRSWLLADIHYPEDDYRRAPDGDTLYGGSTDMWWRETSFCWCFWEISIPVGDLGAADDIMIRAMDEGMMVQPRDMYWSVLGMMNNPWFRVVIHKEQDSLRFEHPTQPALMPGGWMERVKAGGGNLANGFWGEKTTDEEGQAPREPDKEICMIRPDVDRVITLEELKAHEGETEPWFVINGHVYDGTSYLDDHPGGATSIINAAAQDATEEFMTIRESFSSSTFFIDISANQHHKRQRKCQSHDAAASHWHPRRRDPQSPRERRWRRHRLGRRPDTRRVPAAQDLEQSHSRVENGRVVGQ